MEISLYSKNDTSCAAARLRRSIFLLICLLLPLLALYVFAILKGMRLLMLAASLLAFVCAVFCCDFCLLPAKRYFCFLKGLEKGLRRSLECSLTDVSEDLQMQDGARVLVVQVRILDGGGSRIFYANASKRDLLPSEGARIRLTSCGRHIISFQLI